METRVVALTLALGCFGTSLAFAQSALPENADKFREAFLKRAPIGSPIAQAKEKAEALGLSCEWVVNRPFVGLEMPADYYYCFKSMGAPVARRWQLALVPKAQNLHVVLATFGLVAP